MSTQKLSYSIVIDAPREVIWRTLLDDATYREWTSVFAEGSYAVTDWKAGSKALFLGPNGEGMVSRIAVHRPNEHISIEHLGVVKNGVEDLESAAAQGWTGAHESYTLREAPGGVELLIEMDTTAEYAPYFNETWPKALDQVKRIAEGRREKTA